MRIFPILGWMLFPGCWAVRGPGAVRGPAGGSVAVRCRYRAGYEDYPKFWCREGLVGNLRCSDGLRIVQTDGSEAEVTRGRVSIRDDRTQRVFTVTVENLTPADAGRYHCGVERTGPDPRATVELTVSPATSSPPPTERSSSATSSATVQPASSSPSVSTSPWTTTEEGKSSFSANQDTMSPVSQLSNVHFLLFLIWKVPIFLCIICMNIWYRKNSREMPDRHAPS